MIVIVESPTKIKSVGKYLGKSAVVLSSMGHIRELPSKNGSVDYSNGFAMNYAIKEKSEKNVNNIIKSVKGAKDKLVYLATDQDREGEAIAWHIAQIIKSKVKEDIIIRRISFNEITKEAVLSALNNPREIDGDLVDAQESRLALDYLVGFELSPILWRTLPGSRSAGRVQSVVLRLIIEREIEIQNFISKEYWSIVSQVDKNNLQVKFFEVLGRKIDEEFPSGDSVEQIVSAINAQKKLIVQDIVAKSVKQHPAMPFTTSLLQQEASRKLNFSTKKTMQVAQKLYEGIDLGGDITGLITYMRTDATNLSDSSIKSIRKYITDNFDSCYLPQKARTYKSKTRNAQEAHEAIRPTDINIVPDEIKKYLSLDEFKLYNLIWKRTVACQMESAVKDQQTVTLATPDGKNLGKITGSVIKFDGFLRIYHNKDNIEKDGEEDDDLKDKLPSFAIGEECNIVKTESIQHFTAPSPRYTEASLIKAMENLGIGRPATYASMLTIVQDRGYVEMKNRQFFATSRGMLVSSFLCNFFAKYVEYNFTADLEGELDLISNGKMSRIDFLNKFWSQFKARVDEVKQVSPLDVMQSVGSDIMKQLNKIIIENFSGCPLRDDGFLPCNKCTDGKMSLKSSKYGAFFGCSNYPNCDSIFGIDKLLNPEDASKSDQKSSTTEGDTTITVNSGKYGEYLVVHNEATKVTKNVSIPKGFDIGSDENKKFLASLPLVVGSHSDADIVCGVARYGFYFLHNGVYYNIKNASSKNDITAELAKQLISAGSGSKKSAGSSRKTLQHPNGSEIVAGKGRYGFYVLYNKKYYNTKSVSSVDEINIDLAMKLINGTNG